MNLYLLENTITGPYGTFEHSSKFGSCVVCAENEGEARLIHPNAVAFMSLDCVAFDKERETWIYQNPDTKSYIMDVDDVWCSPKDVNVIFLGTASQEVKKGVVCCSFNGE